MKRIIYIAVCLLSVLNACRKDRGGPVKVVSPQAAAADEFAADVLGSWYLWSDEIAGSLGRLTPDTCTTPIAVVREIRYHENGKEVDHWTSLMEDLEAFSQSIQGLGVTYGYDLQYGKIANQAGAYFLLVTYVAKDTPAQKAGLKRGDILISINGDVITRDNMNEAFSSRSITLEVTELVRDPSSGGYVISSDRKSVSMTAVDMYEDPILLTRTFDAGGKRVDYLVYNGFDVRSALALVDSCQKLKSAGIEELILDLRYNGGGFMYTTNVLASLLAPMANVEAEDVFQVEIFNKALTAQIDPQSLVSRFSTTHPYYEKESLLFTVDVSAANPGIRKLYALVSEGSASASEGLLVGLAPYLDIVTIGTRTHGKYCGGYLLAPDEFYTKDYYQQNLSKFSLIEKWGIYVMVSKFADRDGKNAAEPDGILPDIVVTDNPFDGYPLGDENETLLKAALAAAGKTYTRADGSSRPVYVRTERLHHKPNILIHSRKPVEFKQP